MSGGNSLSFSTLLCKPKRGYIQTHPQFANLRILPKPHHQFSLQHTLAQWRLVFWITLGVLAATNVIFVMFASGEEQWWNDPRKVKTAPGSLEGGQRPEKRKESDAEKS